MLQKESKGKGHLEPPISVVGALLQYTLYKRTLKEVKGKCQVTNGNIRITDLSTETLDVRKAWDDRFQVLEVKKKKKTTNLSNYFLKLMEK